MQFVYRLLELAKFLLSLNLAGISKLRHGGHIVISDINDVADVYYFCAMGVNHVTENLILEDFKLSTLIIVDNHAVYRC